MKHKLTVAVIFLFLLSLPQPIFAQDNPTNPVYVVQPGETLSQIAQKFNVTLAEIISINNISNPNLISPGIRLYIPGLKGISGELAIYTVGIGESLNSFILQYQIPMNILTQVNRLTSPNEIYAGSNLIISVDQLKPKNVARLVLKSNQSVLETAILLDANSWKQAIENNLTTNTQLIPADIVYLKGEDNSGEISSISSLLKSVTINPLPLSQGNTVTIKVVLSQPINFAGKLNSFELHFFQNGENEFYALQGIHAMADPGLVSFSLNGSSSDEQNFSFQQMLLLKQTAFLKDPQINVPDQTIDPAVTKPEDDYVKGLISVISGDKFWSGKFLYPLDGPVCYKSYYGNRRSYNGSDYTYFHTGLDLCVSAPNLNIYASASGRVIFAGPLPVRGNAVFIDHGQGIFTGYFHQSQIKVNVGDMVQVHQLIGIIGSTGRATGPHLHFEVWVNGVQVNPLDWFRNSYP
jgi:murein DD-endopeptidase MepM/ murein hydrolase activator NlpD